MLGIIGGWGHGLVAEALAEPIGGTPMPLGGLIGGTPMPLDGLIGGTPKPHHFQFFRWALAGLVRVYWMQWLRSSWSRMR